MNTFNLKQWLIENNSGIYTKTSINESTNETVGWANIERPAQDSKLDIYLDKLKNFDVYYQKSDDPRVYNSGEADKKELRQLYAQLTDNEKQTALDAALEKSEKYYPTDQYPGMGDLRRTWTTKSFNGSI